MSFWDIAESQRKQFIDATQVRQGFLAMQARAATYRGSMYWKKVKGHEYLVRDYGKSGPKQKIHGLRSEETENSHFQFYKAKAEAAQALVAISKRMDDNRKVNAALQVGRTPNTVIDLLEGLRETGLHEHFLVIGTNSLYAYETHAGVRFDGDITATLDVDLLWDSRKRIALSCDVDFNERGLLGVLKRIDSSFHLLEDQKYRAINDKGYMVDLIKRRPVSLHDDKEPQQLHPNPDDFWAVKIRNMDWLLSAPRFTQTVVGVNGRMAEMTTLDPRAFVLHKAYISRLDDRDPIKKPRDRKQAQATYELIQERMPHLAFEAIRVFPEEIKRAFLDEQIDPKRR